ncbi:MAG: hypothetical protein K9L60_06025 [Methylovulum sp.]|nr:hypothetical protein [Methylovulum sp.]MCF7998772.1 hypothetical protein [Methylovulum sp.]
MKMKILAGTISLLCFSQVSLAGQCDAPAVCSTTTIAGVSKTFVFPDQAAADRISAELSKPSPDEAIVGDYVDPFRDPITGELPPSQTGLVTQTTRNGNPITIVQTSTTVSTVTEVINGKPEVTTIVKPAGSTSSLTELVNTFVSNPEAVPAAAKRSGISASNYTEVQKILQNVAAVPAAEGSLEAEAKKATQSTIGNMLVNTVPVEDPIVSVVTLNGITRTFTYASQAEAEKAAISPSADVQASFGNPTSRTGQVVQATSNGVVTILAQTDAKTIVLAKPGSSGLLEYSTITSPTLSAKTLNGLVSSFLSGDKKAFEAAGGTAVKGISDQATLTAVTSLISKAQSTGGITLKGQLLASLTDPTVLKVDGAPIVVADLLTSTEANQIQADKTAASDAKASYEAVLADPNATPAQISAALKAYQDAQAKQNETLAGAVDTSVITVPPVDDTPVVLPAGFVTSTIILNGVAKTYVFKSEAEAIAAANSPEQFKDDFNNPNTLVGMVTQNTLDGVTVLLVRTDAKTMLVGEQNAQGEYVYKAVSLVNSATGSSLNDLVGSFLGAGGKPRQLNLGTEPDSKTLTALSKALTVAASAQGAPASLVTQLTAEANKATALAVVKLAEEKAAAEAGNNVLSKVEQIAIAALVNDKNQAANNPTAAVAGNPASLEGTMVDNAFNLSSPNLANGGFKNVGGASSDQAMGSSFATGLNYGYYNLDGRSANTVTVPLIYGFRIDSKNQVLFTVPLTYASMGNSDQYQIGGGLAYKYNITDDWTFMPAVNYAYRNASSNGLTPTTLAGFINSTPDVDGHMMAGTLTSKYSWALNGLDSKSPKLTLTNMVGYFSSLDMNTTQCIANRCGSFQTSGSVSNYVLKNGLSVGKSMDNFNLSTFFTDTQYFGDSLYFPQYNEFGFAIKPENSGRILDNLSVSANYMFSLAHRGPSNGNIDGFKLNLNYQY